MRLAAIGVALLLAGPAGAQDGLRPTDTRLTAEALSEALAGRVIEFYDASLASYLADGRYEYRYRPEEPPFTGRYVFTGDSAVCVTFENGFSRCDFIVRAGERLVLVNDKGERYPVRAVTEIR